MLRRTPARRDGRDGGFTLVELVVAMGIFTTCLAIFMSAVLLMYRSANRVQDTSASSDELRRTFLYMDQQVRYADGVNAAGLVNGSWYVELHTAAMDDEPETCTQWRYSLSDGTFAARTWEAGTAASTAAWRTYATGLEKAPAAQPFTMLPAEPGTASTLSHTTRQRLEVLLTASRKTRSGEQVRSTFVAANSDVDSPGNVVVSGVSTNPVCTPSTTRT